MLSILWLALFDRVYYLDELEEDQLDLAKIEEDEHDSLSVEEKAGKFVIICNEINAHEVEQNEKNKNKNVLNILKNDFECATFSNIIFEEIYRK